MANVLVAGHSAIITSSLSVEEIKKVQKYQPDALTLKDEEGEPIFKIGFAAHGTGDVSKFGVEFDAAPGVNGKAVVTMAFCPGDGNEDEVKTALAEIIGAAMVNLSKIEAAVPGILESVNAKIEAVKATITIA